MERKNETENPTGSCHKLFNYLAESFPLFNLKQISQGREDKIMTKPTTGPELVPTVDVAVEHLETIFPKFSVSEDGKRRKDDSATSKKPGIHGTPFVEVTKVSQKSVSFRKDIEEKDAGQTKPGKAKDKELKKPSVAQQQENNPQTKILRPRKPVIRAISNIDEKSGLFIQKKRESFASLVVNQLSYTR